MESITNTNATGVVPQLEVHFVKLLSYDSEMDTVSSLLDKEERISLAYAPLPAFPYKPNTRFSMVYSEDCLFFKFYVEEKTVVAAHHTTHAPVFKDSCTEFFISFDDSGYYNLEFNSTGTCLAAFGKGKEGRVFLPVEAVNRIRRQAVINREPGNHMVRWTLTLVVPFSFFVFHPSLALHGQCCRANFYKCGDDLPDPHFLSWSAVETPEPDFHQPRYFGVLHFE